MELLEKILGLVPRLLLPNMSLVCSRWQLAVHGCAVKYLSSRIENGLTEEKQLERWGWSSPTAWDHDHNSCACIRLAFNFFAGDEPTMVQGVSLDCLIREIRMCLAIMSDKIFFIARDWRHFLSLLKVINRLEADSQPRVLKILTDKKYQVPVVSIVVYDRLLAILRSNDVHLMAKVSLWNGSEETRIIDLDISSISPQGSACNMAVSKDLQAVLVNISEDDSDGRHYQM